jgi:hypothetical protein
LPITDDARHTPGSLVDLEIIRKHHRDAGTTGTFAALWTAAADIPSLIAEIDRLHSLLRLARILHANLAAAAYASIAADRDGEDDPLWYIRDEVATIGKLPPRWLSAHDLITSLDLPGSEEGTR